MHITIWITGYTWIVEPIICIIANGSITIGYTWVHYLHHYRDKGDTKAVYDFRVALFFASQNLKHLLNFKWSISKRLRRDNTWLVWQLARSKTKTLHYQLEDLRQSVRHPPIRVSVKRHLPDETIRYHRSTLTTVH